MKLVTEILREKELQLEVVKRQIEALRIVAPLLADATDVVPKMPPQSDNPPSRLDGTTGSHAGK
jgi:hypothetical protein